VSLKGLQPALLILIRFLHGC